MTSAKVKLNKRKYMGRLIVNIEGSGGGTTVYLEDDDKRKEVKDLT